MSYTKAFKAITEAATYKQPGMLTGHCMVKRADLIEVIRHCKVLESKHRAEMKKRVQEY